MAWKDKARAIFSEMTMLYFDNPVLLRGLNTASLVDDIVISIPTESFTLTEFFCVIRTDELDIGMEIIFNIM